MEKGKYDLLDLSKFAKLFKSSLKRKDMPKIFTTGSFEFYFYSNDRNEPEHIHVRCDRATAKFWLNPVCLEKSRHFKDHELVKLQNIVSENRQLFLEAWNEFFSD